MSSPLRRHPGSPAPAPCRRPRSRARYGRKAAEPRTGTSRPFRPATPLPTRRAMCSLACTGRLGSPTRRTRRRTTRSFRSRYDLPDNPAFDATWQLEYKPRINGNFSGTTDEIIQWASCKWGISDDLTRARAVDESAWQQSKVGDFEATTSGHCATTPSRHGCLCPTSFGILQSKWYFRPGVYPGTRISTAFNVDSVLAETPRVASTASSGSGPNRGETSWGCVGLWFSGTWGVHDDACTSRTSDRSSPRSPGSPGGDDHGVT